MRRSLLTLAAGALGRKGAATKHSRTDLVLFKDSNFPKAKRAMEYSHCWPLVYFFLINPVNRFIRNNSCVNNTRIEIIVIEMFKSRYFVMSVS